MNLLPGNADPVRVPALTGPELLAEARRLAGNLDLTGMDYTAAVLRALCAALDTAR